MTRAFARAPRALLAICFLISILAQLVACAGLRPRDQVVEIKARIQLEARERTERYEAALGRRQLEALERYEGQLERGRLEVDDALEGVPLITLAQAPFEPPGTGGIPGARAPAECTVAENIAQTCAPALNGLRIVIIDGDDASECGNAGDTGLGSFENVCRWSTDADAWVPAGGGGVIEDLATAGAAGTAAISDGAAALAMTDVATQAEVDALEVEGLATSGAAGTAALSDGASGLAMTDVATQAEVDALEVEGLATSGAAGTAPLSDGAAGLAMTDVVTEAEFTARRPVLNVLDYGVVADATAAYEISPTNCGWWLDNDVNRPSCAVHGAGTDNEVAMQNALDAACAGDSDLYAPQGDYRFGSGTGGLRAVLHLNCSSVTLYGDGPSRTRFFPGNQRGRTLLGICDDTDQDGICEDEALRDVHIRNIGWIDDDPEWHGNPYIIIGATPTGSTPVSGETVEFSNGGAWDESGLLYRYYDGSPDEFRILETVGELGAGEDFREAAAGGSNWTATGTSVIRDGSAEESHGVSFSGCVGCSFTGNLVRGWGDEAIVVKGHDDGGVVESVGLLMTGNHWDHTPGIPGGGTSIEISQGQRNSNISGNVYDGGVRPRLDRSSPVVRFNTAAAYEMSGIVFQGNVVFDSSTPGTLGYMGQAITINPNNEDMFDITISGNLLAAGNQDTADGDAAALQIGTTGYLMDGLSLTNNRMIGRVYLVGNSNNAYVVGGNLITGDYGIGILVSGLSALLQGNNLLDFPLAAIQYNGVETINIIGNNAVNTSSGNAIGVIRATSSTAVTGKGLISGNLVKPAASASNVDAFSCAGELDVRVIGNVVNGADRNGVRSCWTVNENLFYNSGSSHIYTSGTGLNGFQHNNNRFQDRAAADGLYIANSSYGQIIGNTFSGSGGTARDIHVTGTNDNIICKNNVLMESGKQIQCGEPPFWGGSNGTGCTSDATGNTGSICGDNIVNGWSYGTLAADVPDCDTLDHGTIVKITNDNAAGGRCDHTSGVLDGGGSDTSTCICDPSTDAWADLFL